MRPQFDAARAFLGAALTTALRLLWWMLENVMTLLYHQMLNRNTIRPLQRIIAETDLPTRLTMTQRWANAKASECIYIQLAVGSLKRPHSCNKRLTKKHRVVSSSRPSHPAFNGQQ